MPDRIVFAYLDEPPFCFATDRGAGGSDVELVTAALQSLGIDRFEQRLTTFAELLPGLIDGRWTLTTPLFVTPERQRIVDFSRPVWALRDGLLTRRADRLRITGYASLARDADARLVVVAGQVQERTGLEAGIPDERILRVATQEEAVGMVRAGQADAYASVAMAHRGFLARHPDPELAVVAADGAPPALGAYAFAKTAEAFRQDFDEALDGLLGSEWHKGMLQRYGFDAEPD